MRYVDAHCHLESDVLPANIAVAVTNSARVSDWESVIQLSKRSGVFGAIGIHPWYIADVPSDWQKKMHKLLLQNSHLMLGEIGLDKYKPDMATQIDIFKQQLKIASEFGRVAHIHCVGAWDNVLAILRIYTPPAVVFHAFDASPELMSQLLRYNSYFSFGRAICNPLHKRAISSLVNVPHNHILSESDSNNPSDVIPVVHKMAEIFGCSLADITKNIYNNMTELLKNG